MQTDHGTHHGGAARHAERGAALVTTLLLTMLLLLAGGALIIKTSNAVSSAYDTSPDIEAYYAAEAGLQAALNIMRGNHENAAGQLATFRNAVEIGNSRLDAWLVYNGNNVVPIGDDGYGYRLVVDDPDDTDLSDAAASPTHLDITSIGFGSRGSRRELRMRIRNAITFEIPGAVTLVGSNVGGMTLDLGNSANREFLTDPDDPKPVFVVTNGTDAAEVSSEIDDDIKNNGDSKAEYDDPPLGNTSANPATAELPDFLESAEATESFIKEMKDFDTDEDTLYIHESDYSFTGTGSGTLIVTGKLTIHGDFSWTGVILVLGEGEVEWRGGGGGGDVGNIYGALFIAKYDRDNTAAGFGNPSFEISGGGNGRLSYNRDAAQSALSSLGFRVVGVQEQ